MAPEWLDQAIHGLKTLQPFCVKGFLEPMRMICVVSYWNCHVLVEDDDRDPLNPEEVLHEISHTSMLEFCLAAAGRYPGQSGTVGPLCGLP